MIGIVLAFFNVVASSQILPLLPKAGAKVIQFVDLQKNNKKLPYPQQMQASWFLVSLLYLCPA
ncbi:MAG: hypothetical protein J6R57_02295 [Bacteroidales bacterium]|nr:hypothetical protein [Bacteroidales bacterium]